MARIEKGSIMDEVSFIYNWKHNKAEKEDGESDISLKKLEIALSSFQSKPFVKTKCSNYQTHIDNINDNLTPLGICYEYGTVEQVAERFVDHLLKVSTKVCDRIYDFESIKLLHKGEGFTDYQSEYGEDQGFHIIYRGFDDYAPEEEIDLYQKYPHFLDTYEYPEDSSPLPSVDYACELICICEKMTAGDEEQQEEEEVEGEEKAFVIRTRSKPVYIPWIDTYKHYLRKIGQHVDVGIEEEEEAENYEECNCEEECVCNKSLFTIIEDDEETIKIDSSEERLLPSPMDGPPSDIRMFDTLAEDDDLTWQPQAIRGFSGWPTIEEMTTEVGEDKITEYLSDWKFQNRWIYKVVHLVNVSDETSDNYHYEAIWTIPTRQYPIAQASASIYFTIWASRVNPKECCVDVTFEFEGSHVIQRPGENAFMEQWLFDIIDSKLSIFKRVNF